jgi:nucleoside-diphosphate-sugar epimerase
MKIIITGVAGFIGSHLADFLCKQNNHVFGVDNFLCGYQDRIERLSAFPNFTFYNGSAHDDMVSTWMDKQTVVIHLAGLSALPANQENPYLSYQNNVAVTAGLLEHCRLKGVAHFLFASTSAVYENTKEFPTKESHPVSPNLLYSMGKYHAEDIIRSYHSIYKLPYTIFRFFNVYGTFQDSNRTHPPLIPYVLSCFQQSKTPVLHSDGEQRRDYIHVSDVLNLIQIVIHNKPTNDVYNVSTGTTVSVKEIVSIIQQQCNTTIEPIYRDPSLLWEKSSMLYSGVYLFPEERLKDEVCKYSCGDSSKAFDVFTWKATISLEQGIQSILCDNH